LKPVHPDAVLLLGFGSPASLDELPEFLSRVTGRTPSPELIARTRSRYARIGGSPFLEIAQRQAEALQARLKRKGHALPVALAFLHSPPTIPETVNRLAGQAVRRLIGLPLAAHASPLSTRAYAQATVKALKNCGQPITFIMIPSYYDHRLFLDAVAEKLERVFTKHPRLSPPQTPVLFTAHSLPSSLFAKRDYLRELEISRKGIIRRLGLKKSELAFQSRGAGPGAWLEPGVETVVKYWAKQGEKAVVVSPLGFVSDHMETLFDLDVRLKELAERIGLRYYRAASLNHSPRFIQALADLVEEQLK
jgi:ferrochelatase